jgi:methyltransferase (TIGR00027 family)
MQPARSSRTAEVMALIRALETAEPQDRRLFTDPFAAGFLAPPLRGLARAAALPVMRRLLCRYLDRRLPGARSSGSARTKLIDDWGSAHVAAGARQVVLLGAGFDTRAWRLPAFAGLPVFEVDHPATAAAKRRRFSSAGLAGARVIAVTLDFDRVALPDALGRAGFDPARRTLVIWEGVTNYLTAEAVGAVIRWAGSLAAGSGFIFTYIDAAVLSDPGRFVGAPTILREVAASGEPWTFGFDPAALPPYLGERGLTLIEDLGADQYRARYFGGRAGSLHGYAFYRAVNARVDRHA